MPKNEMDLYYESKKYCPTTIFHYGDKTMEKFSVTKNGACGAVANFKCKSANLKKSTVIVKKILLQLKSLVKKLNLVKICLAKILDQ